MKLHPFSKESAQIHSIHQIHRTGTPNFSTTKLHCITSKASRPCLPSQQGHSQEHWGLKDLRLRSRENQITDFRILEILSMFFPFFLRCLRDWSFWLEPCRVVTLIWWQIYRKAKWWQNDSKMRSLSLIFSVMWCLWSSTARSLASQISEFFGFMGFIFGSKMEDSNFGKFSHVAALKNRRRKIPRLVAVATLPSIRSTMGTVTLSERPRIKIHLSSTKPQEVWNKMIWQSSFESFQFQCFFLGKLDTKLRRAPTFVTMKVAPKPQVMAAAQAEFWVAPIPGSDAAPVHCWPEKNHGFCHASKNLIWNLNSSLIHWSYSISVSLFQHVPMVFFICKTIQHLIVCISLVKIFEESLPPGVVYVWSQGPSCPSRSP